MRRDCEAGAKRAPPRVKGARARRGDSNLARQDIDIVEALGDRLARMRENRRFEAAAAEREGFVGEEDPARVDRLFRATAPDEEPAPRRPASLIRFLAEEGVRDEHGELSALGLGGRVVRKNGGLTLEEAREKAAQAGYLWRHGNVDDATANTTPADLLDALDEDNRFGGVYSEFDRDAVEAVELSAAIRTERDMLRERLRDIDAAADRNLPDDILVRASEFLGREPGLDAIDALERAILEDYRASGAPVVLKSADGTDMEVPFFDAPDDGRGSAPQRKPAERGGAGGGRPGAGDIAADGGAPGAPGRAEAETATAPQAAAELADAGVLPMVAGEGRGVSILTTKPKRLPAIRQRLREIFRSVRDAAPTAAVKLRIGGVTPLGATRINAVLKAAGIDIDVTGYRHEVDAYAARHAAGRHGAGASEDMRGQVEITADDWGMIPDVLASPDRIVATGMTRRGRISIGYWKQVNGHLLYLEEVRRNDILAAVTMRKFKSGDHEGGVPRRRHDPKAQQSHVRNALRGDDNLGEDGNGDKGPLARQGGIGNAPQPRSANRAPIARRGARMPATRWGPPGQITLN